MSKPSKDWKVDGRDLSIGGQIVTQGRDFGPDGASLEEKFANVRLAASAPALLDALHMALEALTSAAIGGEVDTRIGDVIRSAVFAAEGKE